MPSSVELFEATVDCPVCAGSGALLCVRALPSRALVYFCPLCGVAWRDCPRPYVLDEILRLEELAPAGIELPTRAELDADARDELRPASDEWVESLAEFLARSTS